MAVITFQWDPKKNRANRAKHGISFEEAQSAFFDEDALLIEDPQHPDEDDCYRQNDGVIRIISARKAAPSERRQYRARKR